MQRRFVLLSCLCLWGLACGDLESAPKNSPAVVPDMGVARDDGLDVEPDEGPTTPSPATLSPALDNPQTLASPLGQTLYTRISLEHTGGAPTRLISVQLQEGGADTLHEVELLSFTRAEVKQGRQISAELRYLPLDVQDDEITLIWSFEDAWGRPTRVETKLSAQAELTRELNYPEILDLGRVPAGLTSRFLFPILNRTDHAVSIRDLYVAPSSTQLTLKMASPRAPQDPRHDTAYMPDVVVEAGQLVWIALLVKPADDRPQQQGIAFVSTLGTRYSTLRFNSGVPCLALNGAQPWRVLDGRHEYRWSLGELPSGQVHVARLGLRSCSEDKALTLEALALRDAPAGVTYLEREEDKAPLKLVPGEQLELLVEVDPDVADPVGGELVILSDDLAQPSVRVLLEATRGAPCAQATVLGKVGDAAPVAGVVAAQVGQRVGLQGSSQPAQPRHQWSFKATPVNSTTRLEGTALSTGFVPDLPGRYVLQLDVFETQPRERCAPALLEVNVR